MRKLMWIVLVVGFSMAVGPMGLCAEQNTDEKVAAIQEKIYHRDHEFDLTIGYMADDDFFHLYPFAVGYTYHYSDHYGFDIQAAYLFNKDKQLKERLQANFAVQPTRFPEPKYMVHAHAFWKPLYGKDAVLNRWVVNRETYAFVGGGSIHYEWTDTDGRQWEENAPSLSLGLGTRFFMNKKISVGFEIDNLFHFREDRTEYNLFLGFRLGYQFNMKPRKAEDDSEVRKLSNFLKKEEKNAK